MWPVVQTLNDSAIPTLICFNGQFLFQVSGVGPGFYSNILSTCGSARTHSVNKAVNNKKKRKKSFSFRKFLNKKFIAA